MTRARLGWGLAGVAGLGVATWLVLRADLHGDTRDVAGGLTLGLFISGILVWLALFVRHVLPVRVRLPEPSPTLYDLLAELHAYLDSKPELVKYKALGEKLYWLRPADIDRRERLLADLEGHPERADYERRIMGGEPITLSMIAYWRDPAMRALCDHLVAVESALRTGEPRLHPSVTREGILTATAFDIDRLRARFHLPESILYLERPPDPRGGSGSVRLYCQQCECSIIGAHPDDTSLIFPPA